MKTKKEFGWICQYYHCQGKTMGICHAKSRRHFATKEDAARAALLAHPAHSNDLCIYHRKTGYVGLAVGINFHNTKS